jgi:glycolate oxidase FAD binding subunit
MTTTPLAETPTAVNHATSPGGAGLSADDPALARLIDQVRTAQAAGQGLCISGHGSKAFHGGPLAGERLDTTALAGISSYEPTELVVTARAGTPLAELEAVLAERGQCLAFEPPRFRGGGVVLNGTVGGVVLNGTVGGAVATGLSGPARASVGALRDFVLGATLLSGRGEVLSFGGQVMKNVAGYDVSRLLAGSMGVLGVILEVSLKVLPRPLAAATLRFELGEAEALQRLHAWGGQPLPLNASAWWDGMLLVRLSGAHAAVDAALARLGGERIDEALARPFWDGLRDQEDEYFQKALAAVAGNGAKAIPGPASAALWRLSLPQTAAPIALPGEQLIEWGGGQRWWCTPAPAARVREAAAKAGGHATLWRGGDRSAGSFTPLAEPLARIHRELKREFDPAGVFNRGRLYPDF